MSWIAFATILRRIGYFFLDNWKVCLIALTGIVAFVFILNFAYCGRSEPLPDNQQLNEWIEKEREKSAEIFNAQEARTESVVKETQTIDRESKANFNKATQSDYSNVTNDELKKRIQEKAKK